MNKIEIYDAARVIARGKLKSWDQLKDDRKHELTNRVLISTVINRLHGAAKHIRTPEQKLFFQVICTAISDSVIDKRTTYTERDNPGGNAGSAQRYFLLRNHSLHCDIVGLDPEYVINTLKRFFLWLN